MTWSTIDKDIEHTKLNEPRSHATPHRYRYYRTQYPVDSYNMYIHNVPRDSSSRLRRNGESHAAVVPYYAGHARTHPVTM